MTSSSTLLLRTMDQIEGIRVIVVDPNSSISCLKKDYSCNCLFLYKNIILVDTLPFSYYSMSDGDFIRTIRSTDVEESQQDQSEKYENEIELEKLKLLEKKFNRIISSSSMYQKYENLKQKIIQDNEEYEFESYHRTRCPRYKPTMPSTNPLPKFW